MSSYRQVIICAETPLSDDELIEIAEKAFSAVADIHDIEVIDVDD